MANPWIFALIKAIVANCHQLATAAVFTCPGSGVNHPPTDHRQEPSPKVCCISGSKI